MLDAAAVGVIGLLLWANAQWEWGFLPQLAGVLAAAGMTTFFVVFFAVGPSPAEVRAYREAQRRGQDPGARPT